MPVNLLAVDIVPWARAQMAFTLATHIILVPLGVSWAFMALIANYRAIKKDDADALELAQRWSKYMAVTFAVGAVTGTVLTFEFGLLWPNFMGKFGDAFGIPFAVEGLFFFLEAIFIAIYIYGWKRLKPWQHFWTGVPIVIAGIGGTVSVVAANAWMNQPDGFTLNQAGEVVDVDPLKVIFNDAARRVQRRPRRSNMPGIDTNRCRPGSRGGVCTPVADRCLRILCAKVRVIERSQQARRYAHSLRRVAGSENA
jgi:cytochrome d ubiquinol oxidase subunit I